MSFQNVEGQGHRLAKAARNEYWNVCVNCTEEEAEIIGAEFVKRFAMRSCLYYDGTTLSMYCGEAGSGSDSLKREMAYLVKGFFLRKRILLK